MINTNNYLENIKKANNYISLGESYNKNIYIRNNAINKISFKNGKIYR